MITDVNGRILTDATGKVFIKYFESKLILRFRNRYLPTSEYIASQDTMYGSISIQTISDYIANTIYVDFRDNSPIYERDFNSTAVFSYNNLIRDYGEGSEGILKEVHIWFKFPSRITSIIFSGQSFEGEYPFGLSLFQLNIMSLAGCKWDSMPQNLSPVKIQNLSLRNFLSMPLDYIPSWITNSEITQLSLGESFNLANPETNNVNKIINIKNLQSVTFLRSNNLIDIPENFKDIPTLKYLSVGSLQRITQITANINNCKQLQRLHFGFDNYYGHNAAISGAGGSLISWGELGISNMPNLEFIGIGGNQNMTPSEILGLETCPKLKIISIVNAFTTESRLNTFITNLYNQCLRINRHSILVLNDYVSTLNSTNRRPEGVYQPPLGFEQNVSNGEPQTSMERVWILVNVYNWSFRLVNSNNNGTEILAP